MKKLLLVALAAVGLTACVQNEELNAVNSKEAIVFDTFVENATKAMYDNNSLEAFKVYGTISQEGVLATQIFNGVEVSKNTAGAWTYNPDYTQFWIPGWHYDFAAVVDANAIECVNGLPATFTTDLSEQNDVLYATTDRDFADGDQAQKVSFVFSHLLSKAKFTIKNGITAGTNFVYSIESVKIKNADKNGVYDTANSKWTATNTYEADFGLAADIVIGANAKSSDVLLLPSSNKALEIEVAYKLTYNDAQLVAETKILNAVLDLESGKAYNFIIEFGNPGEKIEFDATVEDWDEEKNQNINVTTTDYYIAATYETISSTDFSVYFGKFTESSNKLVSIDYGDGTFGVDTWHTYSAAGEYNVKLYYEKPITEISSNTFSTKTIKSIVIPKNVTRIGSMAFGHSRLTSITFEKESKLTTIEQGAFVSCENLKSILLPDSVTEIGDCVFGGCYNLEWIDGGAHGFSTALGVFYKWLDYVDCHVIAYPASSDIEIVNYAPNHHNIGWGAFVGCKYLKQLDIIINKIYQVNFWDCEQLEYIRLGETTYIENDVIKNCPKLKEINLPLASKIGENCFINNKSLVSINLGCDELKVINTIGSNNASLNTLWISSGVESITDSFNSCATLENIYCKATTPPALTNSFDSIPATAKIYVPYISLSEYKTAEGWSQYADKIVAYDFENNAIVDLSNLQVGDLFEANGVKGVVFQIGDVIKMVSVEEGVLSWSTESITTGAVDADNGVNNMVAIKEIEGWEDLYPAFKWCADYGNGWYLPALNEMNAIYNEKSAVNSTLSAYGFTTLATDADSSEPLGARYHWSSTEYESKFAWELDFTHGYTFNYKSYSKHVRAIFAF